MATGQIDKSRPYCTVGVGLNTYWYQDEKYYDPSTGQETLPVKKPVPPEDRKGRDSATLTCKFCGAGRTTPELMKEHLLAAHRDEVPELDKPPEPPAPPAEAPKPKSNKKRKNKTK